MRQFFNHAARCMWSALSKDTQGRIINHWRRRIAYSSLFFLSLSIVNWGFGSSVRIRYAAQSRWHLNMLQHAASQASINQHWKVLHSERSTHFRNGWGELGARTELKRVAFSSCLICLAPLNCLISCTLVNIHMRGRVFYYLLFPAINVWSKKYWNWPSKAIQC